MIDSNFYSSIVIELLSIKLEVLSYLFIFRGRCSVNTDYVKVSFFSDFVDHFPDFSPVSSPN